MIKLFTDSSSNLPVELLDKYDIGYVQLPYFLGGVEQKAREFDGKAFYAAMRGGAETRTSMVNIDSFLLAFESELEAGNDVLYIGMSSGISGTAGIAAAVASEMEAKYPNRKIICIDTLAASLGEGLMVIEAAELIARGNAIEAVAEYIRERIPCMCQCFTVDDLKYLRKTGRVSGAAALVGSLLGIRPLLYGNDEGKIVMYNKVRGARHALDALAERYAAAVADHSEHIGIAHADNEAGAQYLLDKLHEKGFTGECVNVLYEPVTGSHVGPGTVALFFYGHQREL